MKKLLKEFVDTFAMPIIIMGMAGVAAIPVVSFAGVRAGYRSFTNRETIFSTNLPEARGYDVRLDFRPGHSEMTIGNYHDWRFYGGVIKAVDDNGDGRFDRFTLEDVPNDSNLSQLTNLQTLSNIAKRAKNRAYLNKS